MLSDGKLRTIPDVLTSHQKRLERLERRPRGATAEDINTVATYAQDEPPVGSLNVGDLWIDTDNENQIYRWDGADWILYRDTGVFRADIDRASTLLVSVMDFEATADNLVTTRYQSSAPVSGSVGDLWVDSDDHKLFRWSGSAWIDQNNTVIGDALAKTAMAPALGDSQILTYLQFGTPIPSGIGDLWVDTDASNKLYRWTGTEWVAVIQEPVDQTEALNVVLYNQYSSNPTFDDWPTSASPPTGYTATGTVATRETVIVRTQPFAVHWNVGATAASIATSSGGGGAWSGAPNLEYLMVTIDFKLVSGALTGSGVIVLWSGLTGPQQEVINLATEFPSPTTNQWYRISKVVKRATSPGGTFTNVIATLAANHATIGTVTTKNIVFDQLSVRQATTEEQTAYGTPAATTTVTLPEVGSGKISSYYSTSAPWANGTLGAGTVGDLWYDTDDNNQQYRWDGSNWVSVRDGTIAAASASASAALVAALAAQSTADAAQATADGAIRTYYQATAPVGLNNTTDVGDLWFDTDDGQAYRWNGTTFVIIEDNSIAAALAAAQNAQTTADGKITAYYQTTAPTTGDLGDLWYDTDDKNKPYFCSTDDSPGPVVWTPIRDGTIADAQSTADAALAAATSDGIVPASSPTPNVRGGIGAFFVDWSGITNPDPVQYEVHISPHYDFVVDYVGGGNGPEWFENFSTSATLDARWPGYSADVIITGGQARTTSAAGVYNGLGTVERFDMNNNVMIGKITPGATPGATQEVVFQIVQDPDNLFAMIKAGTNTSIICKSRVNGVDSSAAFSVTTADVYWRFREVSGSMNFEVSTTGSSWTTLRTVTHGMATPQLSSMRIEILCGDTNPSSVLTPLQLFADDIQYGAEAISQTLAAVVDGTSCTIRTLPNNATLEYNRVYYFRILAKDNDGYGPISALSQALLVQVNSPDIAVDSITANMLQAGQIRASHLAADFLQSGVIQTAASGRRVVEDVNGIRLISQNESLLINLTTIEDEPNTFKGELETSALTSLDNFAERGVNNEQSVGSVHTLAAGVNPSAVPPVVSVSYPTSATTLDTSFMQTKSVSWGATQHYYVRRFINETELLRQTIVGPVYASAPLAPQGMIGSGVAICTVSGVDYAMVLYEQMVGGVGNGVWKVRKTNLGSFPTVTFAATYNWDHDTAVAGFLPNIGKDFTDNTRYVTAEVLPNQTQIRFRRYSAADGSLVSTTTSGTLVGPGLPGLSNKDIRGVARGNFDVGSDVYCVAMMDRVWMFDPGTGAFAGVGGAGFNFFTNGTQRAFQWDGSTSKFVAHNNDDTSVTTYTSFNATSTVFTVTLWGAYTWYDSAGTTHETPMSAQKSFAIPKRAQATITTPALPGTGGADEPNAVRFYFGGPSATALARTAMWDQATEPGTGVTNFTYQTFRLATGGGAVNPPATNNFPTASPAIWQSGAVAGDSLPKTKLQGDGGGRLREVVVGHFAQKTADESVTNSATPQNDDHLFFSVEANGIYIVRMSMYYTVASSTTGLRVGFSLPSGSFNMTGQGVRQPVVNAGVASPVQMRDEGEWGAIIGAVSSTLNFGGSALPSAHATLHGLSLDALISVSSTGGTVNFQWAQTAAAANTTTMKSGSWLHAVRVA